MGTKCICASASKNDLNGKGDNIISKLNFTKKYPIGKGGFGRVIKK